MDIATLESLTKVATACLAVVSFGFLMLQKFIEPKQTYVNRIRQLKLKAKERNALALAHLLNRVRELDDDESLRTNNLDEPDLVTTFSQDSMTMCKEVLVLTLCYQIVTRSFSAYLICAVTSTVIFVLTLIVPGNFIAATLSVSIGTFCVFVICVIAINGACSVISRMEDRE